MFLLTLILKPAMCAAWLPVNLPQRKHKDHSNQQQEVTEVTAVNWASHLALSWLWSA